jgi:serine/threonine-protein kinase RsbW
MRGRAPRQRSRSGTVSCREAEGQAQRGRCLAVWRAQVTEDTTASATRTAATTAARDMTRASGAPGSARQQAAAPSTGVPGPAVSGMGVSGTGLPATGLPSTGLPATGLPATGLPATAGERREAEDQVTVRLPAEGAYLSVLRTATAGLAARLDFTLDEIEDLRIAVDEACAMLLSQAVPGASLECEFTLGHDVMTIAVSAACLAPQQPATDTFAWTVLTALAGSVDAHVGPGDVLTIVLRKTRESSGSV